MGSKTEKIISFQTEALDTNTIPDSVSNPFDPKIGRGCTGARDDSGSLSTLSCAGLGLLLEEESELSPPSPPAPISPAILSPLLGATLGLCAPVIVLPVNI